MHVCVATRDRVTRVVERARLFAVPKHGFYLLLRQARPIDQALLIFLPQVVVDVTIEQAFAAAHLQRTL